MAAIIITTAQQRYVIPFETVENAKAEAAKIDYNAVTRRSLVTGFSDAFVTVTNGFMEFVISFAAIETIQTVDHARPPWVLTQQAEEMIEQAKVRQRAEIALTKSPAFGIVNN